MCHSSTLRKSDVRQSLFDPMIGHLVLVLGRCSPTRTRTSSTCSFPIRSARAHHVRHLILGQQVQVILFISNSAETLHARCNLVNCGVVHCPVSTTMWSFLTTLTALATFVKRNLFAFDLPAHAVPPDRGRGSASVMSIVRIRTVESGWKVGGRRLRYRRFRSVCRRLKTVM